MDYGAIRVYMDESFGLACRHIIISLALISMTNVGKKRSRRHGAGFQITGIMTQIILILCLFVLWMSYLRNLYKLIKIGGLLLIIYLTSMIRLLVFRL